MKRTPAGKASAKAAPARKRILIVDDHPMMREGLAQLIEHEADLCVCAQADNAAQALAAIATQPPDLAVVDISLPDKSGLELIKDLQSMHPQLPLLVISMH